MFQVITKIRNNFQLIYEKISNEFRFFDNMMTTVQKKTRQILTIALRNILDHYNEICTVTHRPIE